MAEPTPADLARGREIVASWFSVDPDARTAFHLSQPEVDSLVDTTAQALTAARREGMERAKTVTIERLRAYNALDAQSLLRPQRITPDIVADIDAAIRRAMEE